MMKLVKSPGQPVRMAKKAVSMNGIDCAPGRRELRFSLSNLSSNMAVLSSSTHFPFFNNVYSNEGAC